MDTTTIAQNDFKTNVLNNLNKKTCKSKKESKIKGNFLYFTRIMKYCIVKIVVR